MLNYLKDRFKEYMSLVQPDMAVPRAEQNTSTDPYVDFEITYDRTDIVVNAFSMSKKEISSNFAHNLIENLSDVLEVDKGNINILSKDNHDVVVEVNYEGKPGQAIKHRIKRILPHPPQKTVNIDYNDLDDDYSDFYPYRDNAYGTSNWHCMRCGNVLLPISIIDDWWGEWSWSEMKKDGTLWFLCSNDACCHSGSPVILHHPKSYNSPAGDSYSLSSMR
jgi:hypothetical protein